MCRLLKNLCVALKVADLVGNYKGNFSFATSTLTLKSDGSYHQTVILNLGKTQATPGKWRLYNNGDNRIEFTNFLYADDAGSTIAPRVATTTFNAPVNFYSSGADIIINGDLNQIYTRTQSP